LINLRKKKKMSKIIVFLSLAVLLTAGIITNVSASKESTPGVVVLTQDNLLILNGEVNGDSVGELIVKAKELDNKMSNGLSFSNKKPLYLYLNSPGGSVTSGLELIEALKGLGRPVHTVCAFCASMAFQLVENLDNRYVLGSGIMMSHRAAGTFSGSFGGASPSQLDQRLHLFIQMTKEMDEVTVKRTNGKQTLKSYQDAYSSELWLTGQESVAAGYADSIALVKCDKSLVGTTAHHIEFMGVPITYELDNCPINTSPLNVRIGEHAGITNEYSNTVKRLFLSGYEMKAVKALPYTF
jgi:ATP-dependent Clp protease protease subunit